MLSTPTDVALVLLQGSVLALAAWISLHRYVAGRSVHASDVDVAFVSLGSLSLLVSAMSFSYAIRTPSSRLVPPHEMFGMAAVALLVAVGVLGFVVDDVRRARPAVGVKHASAAVLALFVLVVGLTALYWRVRVGF